MASLNLNKVILAGHLADTPELKQTTGPNPVSVCKVRLIVNRQRKSDGTPGGMDGFDVIAGEARQSLWRAISAKDRRCALRENSKTAVMKKTARRAG